MKLDPPRIRHALILAAGRSHRLDSLHLGKPKPMIEVGGQPLLAYHLEQCRRCGVEKVCINLHYLPEQVRTFAGDGSRWNLEIIYRFEPELTGTAGAVKGFAPHLGSESFLVIYGDNYFTFPLGEFMTGWSSNSVGAEMAIALFHLDDVSGAGVAFCRPDGIVESFVEKPTGPAPGHWANAGLYILEPGMIERIPEGVVDFGKDVIPTWLHEGKRILGVKMEGRVWAVDTPELLRQTLEKYRLDEIN